jgi:hypothetical protein
MSIYREFALFYAKGPYPEFSRTVAELLPQVLDRQALHVRHEHPLWIGGELAAPSLHH